MTGFPPAIGAAVFTASAAFVSYIVVELRRVRVTTQAQTTAILILAEEVGARENIPETVKDNMTADD